MKPIAFGQYTLVRRLARGGMAELFLARFSGPAGVERLVVVKLVASRFAKDPALLEMFADEARIAATLDHPNIGQVLEVGEVDGQYYLAMEHIHGKDLRDTIEASRKKDGTGVPLDVLVVIASKVCAALDFAHEATDLGGRALNIIHRDVSPSNIMLTYHGSVKLVDFGIAKAENRLSLTRPGCIKGKVRYLSPEQMLGEPIDRRSDIFTLGVSLWEAAVGRHLFAGERDFQVFEAISSGTVPTPSSQRVDISPQIDRILMRALSRQPDDRYQTAREMQLDLEQYAAEASFTLSDLRVAELLRHCFTTEIEQWEAARRQHQGLLSHLLQTLPEFESESLDEPLTRTDDQQTIPPDSDRHRRPGGASGTNADAPGPAGNAANTAGLAGPIDAPATNPEPRKKTVFFAGGVPQPPTSTPTTTGRKKKTAFFAGETHGDEGSGTGSLPLSRRPSKPLSKLPSQTSTSAGGPSPAQQRQSMQQLRPKRRSTPVRISPEHRVAITPDGDARPLDGSGESGTTGEICDPARPTVIGSISPESAPPGGRQPDVTISPSTPAPVTSSSRAPGEHAFSSAPPRRAPQAAGSRRLLRPSTGDWAHQASLSDVPRPGTHPYFQQDQSSDRHALAHLASRRRGSGRWLVIAGAALLLLAAALVLLLMRGPRPAPAPGSAHLESAPPGAAQRAAPQLRVKLTSSPSGATVFSARTGQELGSTPLFLDLESLLDERIELHLQGYEIFSLRLNQAELERHARLKPKARDSAGRTSP